MRRTTYLLGLTLIAMLGALSLPKAAPPGLIQVGGDDEDDAPARGRPNAPGGIVIKGRPAPRVKVPTKLDPKAVSSAIDRGVAYLKKQQEYDGGWDYPVAQGFMTSRALSLGMTALAGLTLLHCGVDANDPSIQSAAKFVRASCQAWLRGGTQIRGGGGSQTYEISLAILFLDRLGQRGDLTLLRGLTLQLLSNQDAASGGWGYATIMAGIGWARGMAAAGIILKNHGTPQTIYTDNSNTQFALLALWAGHRHGIRIVAPLARAAARFNTSQNDDGGWPYQETRQSASSLSMTSAGLLGLSLRHAIANAGVLRPRTGSESSPAAPQRALTKVAEDTHIVEGFHYLGKRLNEPNWPVEVRHVYYSLWSLERTAVSFDLRTIGGVDWYERGACYLVAYQQKDGSWNDEYELADTCFALLFLHRADLLPDVTPLLKGLVKEDSPDLSSSAPTKPPVEPKSVPKKDPASDISSSLTPLGSRRPSLESKIQPKRVAPALPTAIEKQHHQTQVDKLLTKMKASSDFGKDLLIKHWRDGEVEYYTPALAKAIPMLSGSHQRKARAALADHCTRLTSQEREEYLHSDDPEVRRAAVVSCAVRDDRRHLTRLIELMQDKEGSVSLAAHEALCSLTGKDFGPKTDAGRTDRARAAADWKEWNDKQGSK